MRRVQTNKCSVRERTVVFARPLQKRGHAAIVGLTAEETAVRTPFYEDAAVRAVAGR